MENRVTYTVEEVVRLLGITPRTLHYYEEMELCEPSARTSGGHRLYDESALQRLRHILRLKDNMGYSLLEIKSILDTEEALDRLRVTYKGAAEADKEPLLNEYVRLLQQVVDRIDEKIARLQIIRRNFEERLERSQAAKLSGVPKDDEDKIGSRQP